MRLPTTSSELERILSCGRSVCAITAGWRGSVTSTAVTFLGGDSWAIQSTRRRSRVSWMAMPSPQLPKPLRGCCASSRMFREVGPFAVRSEEHTSELQSLAYLVCRLLLEKKKKKHD